MISHNTQVKALGKMRCIAVFIISFFYAQVCPCQNRAKERFDVTSVRKVESASGGFSVRQNPFHFEARGVTLDYLIRYAYSLHTLQVEGEAGWMKTIAFDVAGKMDSAPISGEQGSRSDEAERLVKARLRSLLEERFSLRYQLVERQHSVFALERSSKTLRLKAAEKNTGYTAGPTEIRCSSTSMSDFAQMLSVVVERTVMDRTGLEGRYEFDVKWAKDAGSDSVEVESLPAALSNQLGLQLRTVRAAETVLVLKSADVPDAN